MNAPLPSFFRPPSTEKDQTIMRPPNDDFCLQVPNSSDYLIPLPGPRSIAERLLSEATGVTLSETVTTCSIPRVTSPAAPKLLNGDCWETSFMMPKSSTTEQRQIPNEHQHQNNIDHNDKLISLDTPQQTPTTIKPPILFGDSPTDSSQNFSNAISTITLDPSNLGKQGMSYANVHMMNTNTKLSNNQEHAGDNKICVNGINGTTNNIDKAPQPFTIQGFNDRYKANENHSEISC